MDDIKNFLYAWLGKQKKTPNYEFTQINAKNRQRFKCECQVDGFSYIGVGNSTNKKDSQANAALDFCQFLVRTGHLNQNDLPKVQRSSNEEPANQNFNALPSGIVPPHQSMGLNFNQNQSQQQNLLPYKPGPTPAYMAHVNKFTGERKMLEEAEDIDVNAEIHGYWTLENAKSRLHQYLQANRIKTDYKYTSTGPENNRSFFAEMHFFESKTNKRIHANEHGSTKQSASKACALSLVRQLYHLGVIEQFTGERKKKDKQKTVPYSVQLNNELKDNLNELRRLFDIRIDHDGPLLPEHRNNLFEPSDIKPGCTITWSPPTMNWNPWIGCNIDEGPLANVSLEELSENFYGSYKNKLANQNFQHNIKDRLKLPVTNFKQEIMNALNCNSVIIVRGATGCGKTTQIPQFIFESYLENHRGSECNIIVTQPRRISAVSVAERVAFEQCEDLGDTVGYSVRFESILPRPYGGILFCTVGVLLRKLENGLRGVSHVIVDEIHERDINTDFLLVLLRDMVTIYKDLKVILMSATIDTTLFQAYFQNCPIIEVYGQTYPVQEYFLEDTIQMLNFTPSDSTRKKRKDNNDDDEDDEDEAATDDQDVDCNSIISPEYSERTRNSMKQLSEKNLSFELIENLLKYISQLNQPGSVLIFLPGWNLISSLLKFFQQHPFFGSNQFILLPLHSQIPKEDQYKVFDDAPPGKTKIILSTNIAESSITINDIVYVIDSCKVKQKIFTSRNNMTNYATVWASKSNLQQRKGRAGRVRSGYCFYLISRARFEKLDNHATPEIFRTPLLELALSIKLLRLGEIKEFLSRAIEPPPLDAVAEAIISLTEMDAFDVNGELTPLGRILARLPIEPRLGKMIIIGCCLNIGDAACIIAAATTFGEPFIIEGKYLRPMHRNLAGRRSSDHVALLIAYQQWLKSRWHGEDAERDFCDRKALNMQTLRMTLEAKNQLKDIMIMSGFPEECLYEHTSFDSFNKDTKLDILTSLLTYALYPNVCFHIDKRKLITTDGKFALINKNSVNCSREIVSFKSPFFVFGEKIKTRAVSAKQMTMVSPVQLILFACDKVESNENSLICLDNWIYLKLDKQTARLILSMRSALDSVIADCTQNPQVVLNRTQKLEAFSKCLEMLSDSIGNYVSYTKEAECQPGLINTSDSSGTNYDQSQEQEANYEDYEPQLKKLATGINEEMQSNNIPNSMSANQSFNSRGGFSNQGFSNRGRFQQNFRGGFNGNNNNNNNSSRGRFNSNRGSGFGNRGGGGGGQGFNRGGGSSGGYNGQGFKRGRGGVSGFNGQANTFRFNK
ncbi:unnamed protein product [Brachionus calyciflorus]|uniref:RNA helicase n=1 Tax=Brachionus calyciflorus TaxID=104777 RepID=A0A813ZV17_9BILA|nr:unnamed protein product [Brachionus calyciflorus]